MCSKCTELVHDPIGVMAKQHKYEHSLVAGKSAKAEDQVFSRALESLNGTPSAS